jgi:hypothetical protein
MLGILNSPEAAQWEPEGIAQAKTRIGENPLGQQQQLYQ